MGYMKEKVAYIRGLAEGLEIGGDAAGKVINAMIAAMDEMADAIDENEVAMSEVDECLDDIYDELDSIEECIFDDEDDDDDDFIEVECPKCGETVYFDEDMLEGGEELICPNCNATIAPPVED